MGSVVIQEKGLIIPKAYSLRREDLGTRRRVWLQIRSGHLLQRAAENTSADPMLESGESSCLKAFFLNEFSLTVMRRVGVVLGDDYSRDRQGEREATGVQDAGAVAI